jgi:D-alanine-D-alanine ligase
MRIGITYDLKAAVPAGSEAPDDFQEEFDSPATVEAIASVLRHLGYEVEKLGDGRELLERLLAYPPDFVFNFAEGHGIGRSREARVPAVLEMLGIPYSGSDPLTLAATLDKDCAKRLVASEGVAVPKGIVVDCRLQIADCRVNGNLQSAICNLQFPVIIKPAWEGSSKGIRNKCLVHDHKELMRVVSEMLAAYQQPLLIEEYIQGDELTVGIVGNDSPAIVGVMRVLPSEPTEHFIYGLEVKRDYLRQVRYEVPARLAPAAMEAVREATVKVYRALGCRDVSRIDFRLKGNVPYFLEVNPLPGLNPESSDLVILAKLAGWTYPQLIEAILRAALKRHRLAEPSIKNNAAYRAPATLANTV